MEGRLPFTFTFWSSFSFDSTIGASDSIDPADDGEVALGSVAGITPGSVHSSRGGGEAAYIPPSATLTWPGGRHNALLARKTARCVTFERWTPKPFIERST